METDLSPEGTGSSVDVTSTPPEIPTTEGSPDFRELLSDEYKTHQSLQQYKDLNGLVKTHLELEKTLGNRVKLPDENSTEEEINKFYTKLGRPEEASKYELTDPEELPEGFNINGESLTEFKNLAFKLGLTSSQANSLREHYLNKAVEEHKTSFKSEEEMDKEFAEKSNKIFGDKAKQVEGTVAKLIAENLSEQERELFKSQGIDVNNITNDSLLVMSAVLNNVSKKFLSPDTISQKYAPADSVDDARMELNSLVEKRDAMTKFDPQARILDKRIKELYAKGVTIF
jgi:hypothetical protein